MFNACCNKMNIVTLEGKRPMVGAGIEGILFHNFHNKTPISDSYLYLKVRDIKDVYMHPINQHHVNPSYVSAVSLDELEKYKSNIDWKYYAEASIKKQNQYILLWAGQLDKQQGIIDRKSWRIGFNERIHISMESGWLQP